MVHILHTCTQRLRLKRDAQRARVHERMVKIHEHRVAREEQVQD